MRRRVSITRLTAMVIAGAVFVMTSGLPVASAATYRMFSTTKSSVRVNGIAAKNKQKIQARMKQKRQVVQKQHSIVNYFQYLTDGSLKSQRELESTKQPLVLYQHDTEKPKGGASGSVTPVKITESEFLAAAPTGPMYGMVNWWCSAAAVYLSYTPDAATAKKFGIYSGDCTNPNASITGNFEPQRLGEFNPSVPLTFTLRNVDPEDATITEQRSSDAGVCDVDYYRSLGHRDVYAAQYTCDDGYRIGTRDDIQFTVYIFPSNWPEAANIEAVLKKQSSDEDKDGLIRRLELQIGTNPTDADTDQDGLKDGDEFLAYQTSPLNKDTDGDGTKDNVEVNRKSNPLGPGNATPEQLDRWSRLKDTPQPVISNLGVTFGTGTATVSWTTDLSADGIVNWGPTTKYGSHKSDFAFTKSHAVTFSVNAGSVYHYAVRACSIGPNAKCMSTTDFTFETPAAVAKKPTLSGISATVSGGSTIVTWTADIDSDGVLSWGETTAYGKSKIDSRFIKQHGLAFEVTVGKTYHYSIRACDRDGLCTITSDRTIVVTSTPPAIPPVLADITVTVENGSAFVSWSTSNETRGSVSWGLTTAYGNWQSDEGGYGWGKKHYVAFPILPGTTYHYQINSCGVSVGGCVTSPDMTFTTPNTDPVAPTLSDIRVQFNVNPPGYAIVSWTTNFMATGIIHWGPTSSYGSSKSGSGFQKGQTVIIEITPGVTYHYSIYACSMSSPSLCTTTPDATFVAP